MHPPSARIRSEDVITSASIDSLTGNNNRKKVSTVAAENIIDPFDEDILLHNPSIMKRRNLLFPEFISAASPTHEHSPYFRMGSGQDLLVVSSSGVGTVTNNIPSSTDDSSAATGTAIPHVRKRSIEWDDLKTGTYLIASPIIYDNDDNDSQFRHQVDATQIQISTNPTGTFIAKGSSNHRGGESGGSSVGGTGWFRVEKILHTSPRHKIVRATRLLDDLKCILKMASYPDKRRSASSIHEDLLDDETERLNSEFLAYQTAKTLDVRNIPRIIGIEDSGQVRMRFMIMEDIGGESLTRIVQSRMQSISDGIANIRQDSLSSGLLISEALFLFYHVTKVLLDLHGGEMVRRLTGMEISLDYALIFCPSLAPSAFPVPQGHHSRQHCL